MTRKASSTNQLKLKASVLKLNQFEKSEMLSSASESSDNDEPIKNKELNFYLSAGKLNFSSPEAPVRLPVDSTLANTRGNMVESFRFSFRATMGIACLTDVSPDEFSAIQHLIAEYGQIALQLTKRYPELSENIFSGNLRLLSDLTSLAWWDEEGKFSELLYHVTEVILCLNGEVMVNFLGDSPNPELFHESLVEAQEILESAYAVAFPFEMSRSVVYNILCHDAPGTTALYTLKKRLYSQERF